MEEIVWKNNTGLDYETFRAAGWALKSPGCSSRRDNVVIGAYRDDTAGSKYSAPE